jgi:hypothetical protein
MSFSYNNKEAETEIFEQDYANLERVLHGSGVKLQEELPKR